MNLKNLIKNLFGKKKNEDIIATVVFTEHDGRMFYEMKNKEGATLRYEDVNPRFLFPLIRSVERLFWVDINDYRNLTDGDFKSWYLKGLKNTYAKDPKAFDDAFTELMAEKAGLKPDIREFN